MKNNEEVEDSYANLNDARREEEDFLKYRFRIKMAKMIVKQHLKGKAKTNGQQGEESTKK